jgi:hypothetical protein
MVTKIFSSFFGGVCEYTKLFEKKLQQYFVKFEIISDGKIDIK